MRRSYSIRRGSIAYHWLKNWKLFATLLGEGLLVALTLLIMYFSIWSIKILF